MCWNHNKFRNWTTRQFKISGKIEENINEIFWNVYWNYKKFAQHSVLYYSINLVLRCRMMCKIKFIIARICQKIKMPKIICLAVKSSVLCPELWEWNIYVIFWLINETKCLFKSRLLADGTILKYFTFVYITSATKEIHDSFVCPCCFKLIKTNHIAPKKNTYWRFF